MTTTEKLTAVWKLGEKKEYSLKLSPGVVYPIEPQILSKIEGSGELTLLA
jgi:hypothetical protein